MRQNWSSAPEIELSDSDLQALIKPILPGASILSRQYVSGGLANCTVKVDVAGEDRPLLLRFFMRDPREARKEYELSKLLADKIPIAGVLYFSPENAVSGHPYMIKEWIEGERLELAAPAMTPDAVRSVARSVGEVLAGIHAITFPQAGFFNDDLSVSAAIDLGGRGLLSFVRQCLVENKGVQRLGEDLSQELIDFVAREGPLLDQWQGAPSLTHADFGGSNILVSKVGDGEAWAVAAVLDWEFAFSGTPFFDFGNLLRKPLGNIEGFENGVVEGYLSRGGELPSQWRRMSLLADLTAWTEFMTRDKVSDALIGDAREIIVATMREW